MALKPGTRLGSYEILSAIGAGGMGEVYRARDSKLGRDVALKILPSEFAFDADRLARFKREAHTLASLNHPNIAAIYGFEDSSSSESGEPANLQALVLELVEGPTLADRIAAGAIPIDEALPIAKQIAEALEAAHEQGIVHRDLKPANIKLRPDGTVKVLDFGLAKAVEGTRDGGTTDRQLTQSPTMTSPAMTRMGLILGTAAYMSPEQARGKAVDRRADIWAFGAVLYEMLTGAPAFQGEDVGEILAAVVKTEVDWNLLPNSAPASVRTLLRRCLRKDPRQRLGDAGAVRIEIEEALATPAGGPTLPVPLWQRTVPLRYAVLAGMVVVSLALLIALSLKGPTQAERPSNVAHLTLPVPSGMELADGASVVISADGAQVAYIARNRTDVRQLYLRPLNGIESRPIARTDRATAPFFSPDGQWLGFFSEGKLKRVSTTGGVVETIVDAPTASAGSWGPNDEIAFDETNGVFEISSSAGGKPRTLFTREQLGPTIVRILEFLPGGETLLVSVTPRFADTAEATSIAVFTIKTGERKVLIQGGSSAHYLPTGHLVFQRSGTVMAAAFDLDRLEVAGTPVPVLEGVRQNYFGLGAFSCSRAGTCVYVAGGTLAERTVSLVDRTGVSRPLPLPSNSYDQPRFSPKGDKLLFWIQQIRCDIEVYDIARGQTTRLTNEGDNHVPAWNPDGQRIAYTSRKPGATSELFSKPANGSASEERLTTITQKLTTPNPLSWSHDAIAFVDRGDIWVLPMSGGREPRRFAETRFTESQPAFSPDGQWLAYASDESGPSQVYVQPFPGPGEKHPISTDGGSEPVWARSGKELFFRKGTQMMVAEITTRPVFAAARPRVLFSGTFASSSTYTEYDVSPDGDFVMLNSGEHEGTATDISVLLNWFEELKTRVPVKPR